MSLDTNSLGSLFELSRDAVVGVEGETVVFLNPAAEALLSLRVGDAAARRIPDYILSDLNERAVATMKIASQTLNVTAARSGSLLLLCFVRMSGEAPPPSWTRSLSELGSNLFSARLALDAVVGGTRADEDETLRDPCAVLYRSYYRMKRLHDHMRLAGSILNDELSFSPRILSLRTLCEELCATVAPLVRPMGVTVRFEAEEGEHRISADPALMETMLLNLLANSLQRTSGGTVAMMLSRRGDRYILAIDDDGSGVRPSRMAELFGAPGEPDLTDPAAGAGLGLVIARGIAEKHGGALIMESRESVGTCLRVVLPCAKPPYGSSLHHPDVPYRTDGMDMVLTELSVVLDKSIYNRKMFD